MERIKKVVQNDVSCGILWGAYTFFSEMYSIPLAMSNANPARVLGDKGAKLLPPGTDAGRIFVALLAALNNDNNRPLMAYSIISR